MDNTGNERVEAALRESEQRFRLLFESSAAAMTIAEASGRFLQVNPACCAFLQRSAEDLLQLNYLDVVHPDERESAIQSIRAGEPRDVVRRFLRRDGSVVWGHVSATVMRPEGKALYWVSVIQNVTAQKKVEELLRESEERFRVIANDTPAYLWMASKDPPYENTFTNRALTAFFGISDTALGINWPGHIHPQDREWVIAKFNDEVSHRLEFSADFRVRRYDGEYRFFTSRAHPRRSPTGEVLGYAGSLTDITEQESAQRSLRATNEALSKELAERRRAEKQVLSLSERLISAHEEERSRIARELHDHLSQQVAAVAIFLSSLKQDLQDRGEPFRRKFDKAHSNLVQLTTIIRNISHQLHPATLEQAGLSAALRTHCEEFTTLTGVVVDLQSDEDFPDLPPAVSLCLYRVAQEALQNVAKHAAIQSAEIALARNASSVSLTIRDGGRGFEIEQGGDASPGLGILSMRERLRLVGGDLQIVSCPGGGTTLTATVPLR